MRARGLRPRGAWTCLARAASPVLPSDFFDSVGAPDCYVKNYAARYPARMYPCQRFRHLLAEMST